MAKILIIDDDSDFRRMLNRLLTQNGYEVIEARDGLEGVKNYGSQGADLVITDIFMPEKEGIETVTELNQLNPDVKIIVVSGGGQQYDISYIENMVELGASEAFVKPFDPEALLSSIKKLLDQD